MQPVSVQRELVSSAPQEQQGRRVSRRLSQEQGRRGRLVSAARKEAQMKEVARPPEEQQAWEQRERPEQQAWRRLELAQELRERPVLAAQEPEWARVQPCLATAAVLCPRCRPESNWSGSFFRSHQNRAGDQ